MNDLKSVITELKIKQNAVCKERNMLERRIEEMRELFKVSL